jgi:hypothetical protein
MADRPKGVTVVAVLTLLGAIGNFLFTMLLAALCSVGGPPPSGYRPSIFFLILVYSALFLSLVSFVVSSGIFAAARYAWYLSNVLWVSSAIYYSYVTFFLFYAKAYFLLPLGLIVIANIVFTAYFQSEPVKNYFLNSGVTGEP